MRRRRIMPPSKWKARVLLGIVGFLLAAAGAALAYFAIGVLYQSGNYAEAQAASLNSPSAAVAQDAGANAVAVSWTQPASQLLGTTYIVSANPGGSTCTTSTNTCQVAQLTPGTAYNFSVVAALGTHWVSAATTAGFTTLGVTTANLPAGSVDAPYSRQLAATGGSGSYSSWSLASGTLPAGLSLSTATGAITGTPTTVGTASGLTFTVTDSKGFSATSSPLSLTVGTAATTTALSSSLSSVTYGAEQATTFTVTVAPHSPTAPTGSVQVLNGANVLCTTGSLNSAGQASCSPAATALTPSVTAYAVTAHYGGDPTFGSSDSAATNVTVTKDTTTATVSESPSSVTYAAENVAVFTATVTTGHGEKLPISESGTIKVGTTSCAVSLTPSGSGGSGSCAIGASALGARSGSFSVTNTDSAGSGAFDTAVDTTTGNVFVTNPGDGTVSVISEASNTVTHTIAVGANPFGVAVDPATATVFVANQIPGTVSVISEASYTVTHTITIGNAPDLVAVDPTTGTVFAANQNSNTVSVISEASNTVTHTIPVGSQPYGVAVDPTTGTVFATNLGSNTVSVISESSNTVTHTIPVGSGPAGVTVDPTTGTVFTANYNGNTVSAISESSNTVTHTIPVGSSPAGVAVDPNTGTVFAANYASNTVSVISESSNTVTRTIGVGSQPFGNSVDSTTGTVFVANRGSASVSVISEPYAVTFSYGGDIDLAAPVQANVNAGLAVTQDTTTTSVSESPTSVSYGSESGTVFTATATTSHGEAVPGGDTITVSVNSGAATCAITEPASTCTIGNTALPAGGPYSVRATFNGDTNLATSTATAATGLTVTAGPAAKLGFTTQPSDTKSTASITPSPAVTVRDAGGNPVLVAGTSVTIAIGTNPNGGTLSGTATATTNASGVATFSGLSIDKAGTGYTLTATSTGLTGATSTSFNITFGTASKMVFTTQPSNSTAGVPFPTQPAVTVEDAAGNPVLASGTTVTIGIGTNPTGGTLAGTTFATTNASGVATFSGLSINKAGSGYTLAIIFTPLGSAPSNSFNIT